MPEQVDVRTFHRLAKALVWAALLVTVAGIYAATKTEWMLAGLCIAAGILSLFLVQRLSIRAEAGSENLLVFVTKRECSLCEEARNLLPGLLEGTPFRVQEIDLADDQFLRRHFKDEVPVLLWQSEVVARLGWDPSTVRARLEHILRERIAAPPRQSP